jgi:hypothetical protein
MSGNASWKVASIPAPYLKAMLTPFCRLTGLSSCVDGQTIA